MAKSPEYMKRYRAAKASAMGAGGKSTVSDGAKGLPEKISSTVMGRKIEGDQVTSSDGKMKITVTSIEEITDKSLLKKVQAAGMQDPVRAGRAIMPREVAETAIRQGKQQSENYKKNMENNVKGYDELTSAIAHNEAEYRKERASIARGEILYSARTIDTKAIAKKYPRAASYYEAERYHSSSNYMKSSLGKAAQEEIRMGGDHKKAIKKMKKKWNDYANERAMND